MLRSRRFKVTAGIIGAGLLGVLIWLTARMIKNILVVAIFVCIVRGIIGR